MHLRQGKSKASIDELARPPLVEESWPAEKRIYEKEVAQTCITTSEESTVDELRPSNYQEITLGQNGASQNGVPKQQSPRNIPANTEHVSLSVTGMTCASCEEKLSNCLRSMKHVKNVQTSAILEQAAFDLDMRYDSLDDLIRRTERSTGLRCRSIQKTGVSVDVLAMGRAKDLLDQAPPAVMEMTVLDKDTIRICYDPRRIGVRDLLDIGFSEPLQLSPLRSDLSTFMGSTHVWNIGRFALISGVLTIPVLVLAWAPLPLAPTTSGGLSLALATLVQVIIVGPFCSRVFRRFWHGGLVDVELLIVLSTGSAYLFSLVSFVFLVRGHPLDSSQYFETSTLLVTLIMVGRFISAFSRQRAVELVSFRALQQQNTLLIMPEGRITKAIDTRLLQYGDTFLVMPGSKVVTDGAVISGTSEVDESSVTGESLLVTKTVSNTVIAGSINMCGPLEIGLTRLPEENTVSVIARALDEAKLSKHPSQELTTRVASCFIPLVLALSGATFLAHTMIDTKVRGESMAEAVTDAISFTIAVLVVACPCALCLAAPMVTVIAGSLAAKHGIILKSSNMVETARNVSHVVFDKTGTLTSGNFCVSKEKCFDRSQEASTRALLMGLVRNINHPVSSAVARHLKSKGVTAIDLDSTRSLTGKGVEGFSGTTTIRAGNSHWLALDSHPQVKTLLRQALTVFCVVIDGKLGAIYGLEDTLRPEALSVVNSLTKRHITTSIVSGDDDGAVQRVATLLGIPASRTKSRCSPLDKQKYLQNLTTTSQKINKKGKTKRVVTLFCGDGTNDAVALAEASIGVHMSGGTDVAQSAADVVLMPRTSLDAIIRILDISAAAHARIVANFVWVFVYNLSAILLAAGAFGSGDAAAGVRIPPAYAGLGEFVSVLPVILIAMQLRWVKL